MTKYENLKNEMTLALKSGNKLRRVTLGDMVASIEKAATAGKVRTEITDELVDEVLTKYQKTVNEMIETCPGSEEYAARKAEYREKASIVAEFAPKAITDIEEIKKIVYYVCASNSVCLTSGTKNQLKKLIMPALKKEHCDMKLAQQAIEAVAAQNDEIAAAMLK